jgi:hypothetical protein
LKLLDLHLPDMLGNDVLAALRLDPALASAPAVVVCADVSEGQMQAALAAVARSFLTSSWACGAPATMNVRSRGSGAVFIRYLYGTSHAQGGMLLVVSELLATIDIVLEKAG